MFLSVVLSRVLRGPLDVSLVSGAKSITKLLTKRGSLLGFEYNSSFPSQSNIIFTIPQFPAADGVWGSSENPSFNSRQSSSSKERTEAWNRNNESGGPRSSECEVGEFGNGRFLDSRFRGNDDGDLMRP
jgi:hypothetical protein